MSDAVEGDHAEDRQMNTSEETTNPNLEAEKDRQPNSVDESVNTQAKLSEMFERDIDLCQKDSIENESENEVDEGKFTSTEEEVKTKEDTQEEGDKVNMPPEVSLDEITQQQPQHQEEVKEANLGDTIEDSGEKSQNAGEIIKSHHSIPRPSDIAHLTIRDLDTNEEVNKMNMLLK